MVQAHADFVVVGGGIGGAVLAAQLGLRGRRVIVLEKTREPLPAVRPEVLWPASTRVLESLLSPEAIQRAAVAPMRGVEMFDGHEVVPFLTPKILDEERVHPWSTNPSRTREELLALGTFEVRRGMEVTSVLAEFGQVVGVRARDTDSGEDLDIRAAVTIGDDGARSLVRTSCGLRMAVRKFPIEFLCFALDWPAALPPDKARIWVNAVDGGAGILAVVVLPLPEGKGAGLVPVLPRLFDRHRSVRAVFAKVCAQDPVLAEVIGAREFPEAFVRIARPWGHVDRYYASGAVLLGDAAHPVSPVGGQGANMAIADAVALAEVLLEGRADALQAYEARRRPANERSLRFTRIGARVWELPDWLLPAGLGPRLVRQVGRPGVARRLVRTMATAFEDERPVGEARARHPGRLEQAQSFS